jgi:DNA-binding transcriptional ArsR family regulator
MEGVLWHLLASSRGGPSRVRIVRALDERPRNANELATELDLDYTTIRHHLDVMMENNVVRRSGDEYAAVYLFTDQLKTNRDTLEEVLDTVDPAPDSDSDSDSDLDEDEEDEEDEEGKEHERTNKHDGADP